MKDLDLYHKDIQQPYRIQKRLVLNQCFKKLYADANGLNALSIRHPRG